ncbi:hypothetical protein CDL12_23508 [Handroanthus impetiginosus]|uniref:BHLH domain-containing protein n=1 Tax=Handroanthus impetiginosus TaxID=429701 RepID=A0A2G9GF97_9LAMI|nr:hypothetical protein CDL12_23508 [Handroanthus impetiginosus]
MENCFCPQEYSSDNTLMVPWLPPGDAAAPPLQYHWYPQAAVVPQPWASPPFEGAAEDRTASGSRSHSEAEKRRRDRINAQLATLRKLIPKSEKMDKAALLGHVVNHVREQSKRAKEVSKISTIPTEIDQITIDYINAEETTSQDNQNIYMKASICCEDREQVFAELNRALKELGVTIVQAEITSVGGRMNTNFILCAKDSSNNSLKQSLKLALNRVLLSSAQSSFSARSKRQRFFLS